MICNTGGRSVNFLKYIPSEQYLCLWNEYLKLLPGKAPGYLSGRRGKASGFGKFILILIFIKYLQKGFNDILAGLTRIMKFICCRDGF